MRQITRPYRSLKKRLLVTSTMYVNSQYLIFFFFSSASVTLLVRMTTEVSNVTFSWNR